MDLLIRIGCPWPSLNFDYCGFVQPLTIVVKISFCDGFGDCTVVCLGV